LSVYSNYIHSYALTQEFDKEFFETVGVLFFTDEIQGMKVYPQHSTVNRLDHITSVTYMSYVYARRLGLDYKAATRGAMLHDLFYYDWHDKDWSHRPHGYRHPGFAVKNAKVLNPQITEKELNIIHRHMWPLTVIPPKSAEGFVVSVCDKYCATAEMLRTGSAFFGRKFTSALSSVKEYLPDV